MADNLAAVLVAAVTAAGESRGWGQDPAWQAVTDRLRRRHPSTGEAGPLDAALARIAAVFALTDQETDLLAVIAAAEVDSAFAVAYGRLTGAGGGQPATAALALELAGIGLLSGHGRALLSAAAPLRRWGLISAGAAALSLDRPLTISEPALGALLSHPIDDPLAVMMSADIGVPDGLEGAESVQRLSAALSAGAGLAWVEDTAATAGAQTAAAAFEAADMSWSGYDLERRPAGTPLPAAVSAIIRRAGLAATGVVLRSAHLLRAEPEAAEAIGLLSAAPIPVVLVGRSRWDPRWRTELPVVVRAAGLDAAGRLAWWRRHLPAELVPESAVAGYRLTPDQIAAAGRHVISRSRWERADAAEPQVIETVRLLAGAGRIRPGTGERTGFADIELPAAPLAELHRLADWVRVRETVLARGQVHGLGGKGSGITALFTGAPGTGKTLAAHVIADSVGLDLMQVDLSGVIDKYIGETEKNLERVFTEAENLNVVLFFDEADALFGSRSEVKDARDRYANQEVSYLLQRMEHFDGITVLATNLRGNLDAAFSRRMHFVIAFPDPDLDTRRRLWTSLLGRAGDLDPADPPDVDRLAGSIELAGGDLRNIVLAAAYDATIAGTGLGHRHLVTAAVREFAKLGRRVPAGL